MYDYWQPLPVDELTSSQDEQEIDNSDDGEGPVMEDEEEGTNETEDILSIAEDENEEDRDDTMDDSNETRDNSNPEEKLGDNTMDDSNETGDDLKLEERELNQEMDPKVRKQLEAGKMERTEGETEHLFETRETSHRNQVASI